MAVKKKKFLLFVTVINIVFSSWYTRITHRCYYTSPRQGYTSLYFSNYGLFNLLFSSVMGLYATKKLNFRFSAIFFSTSQTLSYATVSGSRFLLTPKRIYQIANLWESLTCWKLELFNTSYYYFCLKFELMVGSVADFYDSQTFLGTVETFNVYWWKNFFDDAIKKVRKNQMLSDTKTNVYRLVFS